MTRDREAGNMKKIALPTTDLTVDEVMQRWPSTIRIFLDFGMGCVGCPIATFHSIDDACREHRIDLEKFLERLHVVAQTVEKSPRDEVDYFCPSAIPNKA
jgi:hybrid cluster-associated redox disulfide protein